MGTYICNVCEKNTSYDIESQLLDEIYNLWVESKKNLFKKESATTPCCICLGLLDIESLFDTFDQVSNLLSSDKHVYERFNVSLTLPKCVLIRKNYDEVMRKTSSLSIKDALRVVIAHMISKKFKKDYHKDALFMVELNYSYTNDKQEVDSFMLMSNFRMFDSLLNRKRKGDEKIASFKDISDALEKMNNPTILEKYSKWLNDETFSKTPPSLSTIRCNSLSIFVGGRYNKYSRNVAQTPWFIEKDENDPDSHESYPSTSVQEIIVKGLESHLTFTGREDVDVRMLGRGRPFIMELIDPIVTHLDSETMAHIENSINTSSKDIRISYLQIISDKKIMDQLYHGTENISKNYLAVVIFKEAISQEMIEKINNIKDFVINQSTPFRVLHRRVASVRQRSIYTMNIEPTTQNPFVFLLSLKTQSGTYIKEFVHGDMGRTTPSLNTITGVECDILSLDVKDVELNWPPQLNNGAN